MLTDVDFRRETNTTMSFAEIPGFLHDDPPMSADCKSRISVLSEDESMSLWDRCVSRTNRHFMLLDEEEWPAKIVYSSSPFYCWLEDWNANEAKEFTLRLNQFDKDFGSEILVFWMRETLVRTTWQAFTTNWINFLYEDEGVILLSAETTTALVLSNGYAWIGNRLPI